MTAPAIAFDAQPEPRRRVISGAGASTSCGELFDGLEVRRAVLVTSASMSRSAVFKDMVASLGPLVVATHTSVAPHAPVNDVRRLRDTVALVDADVLVSVGGASVIDTAKAVIHGLGPDQCRHLAVPALFGGAEMTPRAGVTDAGVKRRLSGEWIVPDLVVLDPFVPASLPDHLVRPSIGNAMAHCLEGVVSPDATPFSDAAYLHACSLMWQAAPRIGAAEPAAVFGDLQAGAALAAVPQVRMGVAHALAHAVSPIVGIPHATAHSVVMRPVALRNARRRPDRFRGVIHAMGHPDAFGAPDATVAPWLAERLTAWMDAVAMPRSWRELVDAGDIAAMEAEITRALAAELGRATAEVAAETSAVLAACWGGEVANGGADVSVGHDLPI